MMLSDERFLKALRAISGPNRLEIIRLVSQKQGEEGVSCATVLQDLGVSQSTLSHHVSELREAGVLIGVPDGRMVRLSINRELMDQVRERLAGLGET